MDICKLLILVFMMINSLECSESDELQCGDNGEDEFNLIEESDELQCGDNGEDEFNLIEGEAFYIYYDNLTDEEITWYKNGSQIESISNDETENVHYHGGALFFLNIRAENAGLYIARHEDPSGECSYYCVEIQVFKDKMDPKLLTTEIENSDRTKKVPCPDVTAETCETFGGNLTWMKNFEPLQGRHEATLRIDKATKKDDGIYTCTCTWRHHQQVYKSSMSRKLIHLDPVRHLKPKIISPTDTAIFANEGYGIKLNCTVSCGINVNHSCQALWRDENGCNFTEKDGYHSTMEVRNEKSKSTFATAVLTIKSVSAKDFQTEFKCVGKTDRGTVNKVFTLKRRETIIPLVIGGVCVLFFFVLAAVLVKRFTIDLTLLFRHYFPLRSHNKDARLYDAYVVYQMQNIDKATEDTLCQFITKYLPDVLEEKCGYRLFIHGRDDIPGEDRVELVEDCMKQSRRLMVILTPSSGSGSDITDQRPVSPHMSMIGGFDWQVGLHHVLVQREMSVILIQLGDTGPEGYTHLPPGLQHLIQKSAPIRWPESLRGANAQNSRFWKRVRYLMPATPAKNCQQSAFV